MGRYALLWTDRLGRPHLRTLTGSEQEARAALDLLAHKYETGEGFYSARVVDLSSDDTLESIRLEAEEAA